MARILLIDDDGLVRYSLKSVLQAAGHEVVEADNGVTGMAAALAEAFDLVVTDIIMPEKEGVATIIEVKEHFPTLPVIAISGGGPDGYTGYLESAKMLGADHVLEKPVASETLIDAVEACLQPAQA